MPSHLPFSSNPPYLTQLTTKLPYISYFEANILRIFSKEINCQSEYAPPHQFYYLDYVARDEVSFIYGGRSIRRAVDDNEDIKLEASMFDGYVTVPKLGDVASGEDLRHHISVIVDISRGDGGEKLEFLCSAWPDHLEIQKVYLLGHRRCWLKRELQKTLREYLEARGGK
ncbi:hypothetical protein H0E87_011691 [Populus deltoides]|uniref:Uncharacterized protein n=1 Tax=Populus deltoides TaxID=3696 RepID=A0A8T2YGJ8_POPDE|nr:hypothetical protein H0E87_011691 [Populus deltoides]